MDYQSCLDVCLGDRLSSIVGDDGVRDQEAAMRLRLNAKKPCLAKTDSLCNFRTSKAYLWGLVRDHLDQLQKVANAPLLILDAACHALITRGMFPQDSRYYGLDIAKERLIASRIKRLPGDTLYWADLTKALPLQRCFDVVVSCNTLSHLPPKQQAQATANLIDACRPGGDLLINASIDQEGLMPLTMNLLKNFDYVEPIYFDSFLSQVDEEKNMINAKNVVNKTLINEQNLPNDACIHQQVLFRAHGCLRQGDTQEPPQSSKDELLQLTDVPQILRRSFANDIEMMNDQILWNSNPLVLLSSGLYNHEYGHQLRHKLKSLGVNTSRLGINLELPNLDQPVIILGLEQQWCFNLAEERLAVNRVRDIAPSVTFALVSTRAGKSCQPSLVAQDV
jgi:hypothetical protein